jgi:multiple sugar transport system permease protein
MALRSLNDIAPPPPPEPSGNLGRHALSIARWLTIYGLLLGGAAVFAIPFIWMIGTSLKVDREMFGEGITLLPQRPIPAAHSPFLDAKYFSEPRSPRADRIRPWMLEQLAAMPVDDTGLVETPEARAAALFPGVYRRLNDTVPDATWSLDETALQADLAARVDTGLVAGVFRAIYRSLEFGSLRVRSLDLQEQELAANRAVSSVWTLSPDAPATLQDVDRPTGPSAILAYDFRGRAGVSFTMTADLALPFAAERLHRIQVSIQPDDSWHRIDFAYEKNGKRYEATRPVFLGDNQALVATLQEHGPEDESHSGKIRLWYACREVGSSPDYEARPGHVRVIATMTQASQLDAWWAKAYRNYRGALNYIPFGRYVATSAFLVILNIIGTVISCSLVAFAFARLQWPGRQFSFALMMATMMIPPQVTMIPYFLIIKHLGWYNTLNPLWVISFFGNAFNIFLLRQFMKGIPRDLEDAARIDGCNFLQVYWHVIMPLIKPTLACIAIFTFMGVWNDFMGPLIYLSDQPLYPLSLGLYALNVQEGGNYGMMMAGSFLMTLPVVILFFFAQKYFIQGVTLTGMKG